MSTVESALLQEVSYRNNHYKPCVEIKNFIHHISCQHYWGREMETVLLVRRALDELTNESALRLSVAITEEAQMNREPSKVMKENYTAYNSLVGGNAHRMLAVSIITGENIDISEQGFIPLKGNKLHPVRGASNRIYVGLREDADVQFVSIYHQLQNLVCAVADRVQFYVKYNPEEEKYWLVGRPMDQVKAKKADPNYAEADVYQVMIMLQIPPERE